MGTLGLNEMPTDRRSSGAGKKYEDAVGQMSAIEEDIGLSLAKNSQLTEMAAKIQRYSGVGGYEGSSGAIKDHVNSGVGSIGGARSFKEGWGTLGGSVNAVMNQIESTTDYKTEYSISHTAGHPYFPKGAKKPEFDKKIAPSQTVDKSNPDAPGTAAKLLAQVCYQCANQTSLMTTLTGFDFSDEKRFDAIRATRSMMASNKDMDGMLGALLDITLDKHSSGDNANYVALGNNPANPNEREWIQDTVSVAKPIVSGPSGHTLRYLNFWAEKRDDMRTGRAPLPPSVLSLKDIPSLQATRLVMMADLMPPKHHSYDEVMSSSIGTTDGVSAPLKYESKSSYLDLAIQGEPDAHDIALQAYKDSKAYEITANKDLDAEFARRNAGDAEQGEIIHFDTVDQWKNKDESLMQDRAARAQAVDDRNEAGRIWESTHQEELVKTHNTTIDQAIEALSRLPGIPNVDAILRSLNAAKKELPPPPQ